MARGKTNDDNFFGRINFVYIFAVASKQISSGCSAVRLAHLLWEQGVPGSNPGIPTREKPTDLSKSGRWAFALHIYRQEIINRQYTLTL